MKRVAVVGAFDRYNYGDLLFPLILAKWLETRMPNSLSLDFFGIRAKDMSVHGGVACRRLADLSVESFDGICVAGGQVLNARWSQMHLNLLPSHLHYLTQAVAFRVLGRRISDGLARSFHGGKTDFPWIMSPAQIPVVYNAVGGGAFRGFSASDVVSVTRSLRGSAFLSVRDATTKDVLNAWGVDGVRLAPDCAVLLSTLFPKEELLPCSGHAAQSFGYEPGEPYIAFQVGWGHARGIEKEIARGVVEVAERTSRRIVFLPIGRASGHDDYRALVRIRKIIGRRARVSVADVANVNDVLSLIANADLFMGTSLHGTITAISYSVPSVALGRVPKLQSFLESYPETRALPAGGFGDMSALALKALSISPADLESAASSLTVMADRNVRALFDTLLSRR